MVRFAALEFELLYYHILMYDNSHDNCDMCESGREVIRSGIGIFLRCRLEQRDRYIAGSDTTAIYQGTMSLSMAEDIIRNVSYVSDKFSQATANGRLQTFVNEHFPGINVTQHIGPD
jgi:hypothetical protein